MRARKSAGAMLAVLLMISAPAALQGATPRDLAGRSGSWRHAATKFELPEQAGGLKRRSVQDYGAAELDVVAQYGEETDPVFATVYLFRPAVQSVPLWFDRSRTAIESRTTNLQVDPASATPPMAFAPPGSAAASGLRTDYAVAKGAVSTTALAVAPADDWLLVIRMSSRSTDRAALRTQLDALIAGLGWPKGRTGPAAIPIAACPKPLKLKPANLVRPSPENAIAAALIGSVAASAAAKPAPHSTPPTWCRDRDDGSRWAMYRANGASDRYLLAIGDAGRVIDVEPSLAALLGGDAADTQIGVTFRDLDSATVFPSFDALPPPEQALADLAQPALSRTAVDAKGHSTITLSTSPGEKPK